MAADGAMAGAGSDAGSAPRTAGRLVAGLFFYRDFTRVLSGLDRDVINYGG